MIEALIRPDSRPRTLCQAGGLPGTEDSQGFEVVALVMLASLVGVGVMKWRHWL